MMMTEADKALAESGVRHKMATAAVKAFNNLPGDNKQREEVLTKKLDISERTLRHWMGRGPTRVMDFAALMMAMGAEVMIDAILPADDSVPVPRPAEPAKAEQDGGYHATASEAAADLDKAIVAATRPDAGAKVDAA